MDAMTKPNFFIVGAPKCGTTALHAYLSEHPNVFLARVKEPHYFAPDLNIGKPRKPPSWYFGLFGNVLPEHTVRGEASVFYSYSSVAIEGLRDLDPDARVVFMVRDPVDLVYSLHGQLLYTGLETESEFERAWRLQSERRRSPPLGVPEPKLLQYSDVASLGRQLQRILTVFPRSQVKTILFTDMKRSAGEVYRDVLTFLGLPDDGRAEFSAKNVGRQARWFWPLSKGPQWRRRVKSTLLGTLGEWRGRKAVNLMTWAIRKRRQPLDPELRTELVEHFQDDVGLLSEVLKKNVPWGSTV